MLTLQTQDIVILSVINLYRFPISHVQKHVTFYEHWRYNLLMLIITDAFK